MTNEAKKVELTNSTGFCRRFACAAGTDIKKGTLCKLADHRTAIISSGAGDKIAGIAASDKDGTDASTSIGLWTDGVFEMYSAGTIAVGAPVVSNGGDNKIKAATTETGAAIIGYALEAAVADETINVRVRL